MAEVHAGAADLKPIDSPQLSAPAETKIGNFSKQTLGGAVIDWKISTFHETDGTNRRQFVRVFASFRRRSNNAPNGIPRIKKKFAENETNRRRGYCHLLAVAIRDDIESPRRPAIIF